MSVEWENGDDRDGFALQMLAVVVVSAIISAIGGWGLAKLTHGPSPKMDRSEITALQRKTAAFEDSLKQQVLETATLRRQLANLTSENGIIVRLVGHVKALKERNQLLTEIVMQQQENVGSRTGISANGLTMTGAEGAALSEQNIASPTRLMVVTPSKNSKAEPEKTTSTKEAVEEGE
ncbi:hypothetical protein [Brucella sp. NBRC 12950]|uniref:hypothetical protein n=1 Tax=Brucella sp. NBRC 12950 TaxID=2994518 RepID=UPI0024A10052|nr:hypothetical protein [Brucella sp. NBRC 12950]GLU29918.1 hypothetical protein Brsp01_51510 [Brucella sp. NBRC 12950]